MIGSWFVRFTGFWFLHRLLLAWLLFWEFLSGSGVEFLYAYRLFIGWLKGDQTLPLIAHFKATIQMLPDIHFSFGITSALRAGWDLQVMTIE